ncbi:hypothetical protein PBILCG01_0400400 [Plasmodium sp. DRC-Itaito]|nr:hypothetical protein PBILCG01_0400400 [Plasmodium sp. DRC-Itaito]
MENNKISFCEQNNDFMNVKNIYKKIENSIQSNMLKILKKIILKVKFDKELTEILSILQIDIQNHNLITFCQNIFEA